jgi:hypothetical protein
MALFEPIAKPMNCSCRFAEDWLEYPWPLCLELALGVSSQSFLILEIKAARECGIPEWPILATVATIWSKPVAKALKLSLYTTRLDGISAVSYPRWQFTVTKLAPFLDFLGELCTNARFLKRYILANEAIVQSLIAQTFKFSLVSKDMLEYPLASLLPSAFLCSTAIVLAHGAKPSQICVLLKWPP